ncbi:GNAT family N-acetyltransferase [Vibrio sonorensis]|nr:GNAT family N-acetyltransferase [Vibrio sonorensis]
MELTTPRLTLRRFKPSDREDVFAYMSDEKVTHYLSEGQLDLDGAACC